MNTLNPAVEAFSNSIEAVDGKVKNRLVTKTGAYCRALLPLEEQVLPRDVLRHGAALRGNRQMIQVVPFVFRQVCTNGAIWSHSAAAFSMETTEATTAREIEEFVASSTETAASAETFQSCLEEVRSGIRTPIDPGLLLISLMGSRDSGFEESFLEVLLRDLPGQPQAKTRYDAMNLVTAAAREVRDPEMKWKMEALATTLLVGVEAEKKELPSFGSQSPSFRSRTAGAVC